MKMGIQKAIVALIGSVVTLTAAFTDLEPDFAEGLVEPVAAVATAILVYFVPNKEKEQ